MVFSVDLDDRTVKTFVFRSAVVREGEDYECGKKNRTQIGHNDHSFEKEPILLALWHPYTRKGNWFFGVVVQALVI
jgi:hypothetical protein